MTFADLPFSIPGDLTSWIALLTSLFGVWQTAFKRADLKVFVPPTVRYASPYQNSNFEAFEIPVTILNQGARSGTVLAMELTVEPLGAVKSAVAGAVPAPGQKKRFYAAGLEQWNLEIARGGAFRPFVPIALAGRTSRSRTVLFHARHDEQIMQVANAVGDYRLELRCETALARDSGILARLFERRPEPLSFVMTLPVLDHRAFTSGSGTLMLHQKDYRATS